jgi:hypothetical protein
LEWQHLVSAIQNNKPFNEVERGVMASVVTAMGRFAAHTGQLVTLEQMMKSEIEFAPGVDKLTMDGPAPIMADENGKYPVPVPGVFKDREYAI